MGLVKLVGIDLGTSGVRYECYDLEGNIFSTGRAEIKEQSCKEWLESLQKAIPKDKGFQLSEEVILSAQSTSGTTVIIDDYGNEVIRPFMYFERAPEEIKEVELLKSAQELKKRGSEIAPTSPLPKIIHVKEKYPDRFKRARWIISPTTWLLHKLHYREDERWESVTTDWTNALKFGVDLSGGYPAWYTPVFEDTGVSLSLLPEIVPCGEEIGQAESVFAEKLGLRGSRIFQGMTDGNASALAVGCLRENDFGFSCGTTTAVKYTCNTMKVHKAIYYHKHPFEGYLAGAAPITAGMLDWFARKIMDIEVGEAFKMAEKVEPENEYQFFPQGDRSPFNDPALGASFIKVWPDDISADEARGRFFRSIIIGLTFFEHYYIELFEGLFKNKISEARITGGGTRSSWWNSLRASIFNIPVRVMEERPGIGALIPTVVKLNLLGLGEVIEKLLRVTATYLPDKKVTEKYEKKNREFLKKWETIQSTSHVG